VITIPEGRRQATFQVTTTGGLQTVTTIVLTASYGGVTRTFTLTVTPTPNAPEGGDGTGGGSETGDGTGTGGSTGTPPSQDCVYYDLECQQEKLRRAEEARRKAEELLEEEDLSEDELEDISTEDEAFLRAPLEAAIQKLEEARVALTPSGSSAGPSIFSVITQSSTLVPPSQVATAEAAVQAAIQHLRQFIQRVNSLLAAGRIPSRGPGLIADAQAIIRLLGGTDNTVPIVATPVNAQMTASVGTGTGTPADQATISVGECVTLRLLVKFQRGEFMDVTQHPNTTFFTAPPRGTFTAKNVWCPANADANKVITIYGRYRGPSGQTITDTVIIHVRRNDGKT
jgi:hypothetical protein